MQMTIAPYLCKQPQGTRFHVAVSIGAPGDGPLFVLCNSDTLVDDSMTLQNYDVTPPAEICQRCKNKLRPGPRKRTRPGDDAR